VNPLIYKLVDRIKHPITDSAIRDLRPTIKVGNLYALYNFDQGTNLTPYSDFAQLKRKLPKCILEWLGSSGYNPLGVIQSHVWPVMFAKMDLLAIAPNSEERILTFVLSAITWIIQEQDHHTVKGDDEIRPIVLIFTPTVESVKQIQQLIKLLDYLLSSNGYEENLKQLISVEQPVQLFQAMSVERKQNFSKCKYVIFDEFDKMMKLGYMDEVANILLTIRDEKMFDGDVCLNVFSAEFSVFEKLVSLEFLENYHYFNMVEVTGQQLGDSSSLNNFSHIQQYVEVIDVGMGRLQSLHDLLKRILEIDRNSKYAIIVFLTGEDATLFAVYNRLISDMPNVSKQVFYNQSFASNSERSLFWQHFESHKNPILLTNDMRISKKGEFILKICYMYLTIFVPELFVSPII
jgi:superfamily II DNA/RNA helicase